MRSRSLDLVRFIYMLIICLWHTGWVQPLCKGYSPVEFYFLTSGFFLYRLSEKTTSISYYVKSRLKRLYPTYLISLILYVVLLSENYRVLDFIYELFLVQDFIHIQGMNYANVVVWYVSVLFWAGMLVLLVLRLTKNVVFLLVCALFIYWGILKLCGNFNETFINWGIVHIPFWRGFAGLILGACLARIDKYMKSCELDERFYRLLRIAGVLAFVISIVVMFLPFKTEILSLLCYSIVVLVCISTPNNIRIKSHNLPDITYEMFLLHMLSIAIAVKALDMVRLLDILSLKYATYILILVVLSYLLNRLVKYITLAAIGRNLRRNSHVE